MKQKVRPLSPHLTIYKPQLTSVLSIFHRITGSLLGLLLVLSFVLFYYSLFYVGSSFQYSACFDLFSMLSTFVLAIGYFIVFVVSYHMLNGIRHLSWDLALGLEIKNLYTTGMIVSGLVFFIVLITILV
jgi:succinate dehydrogenase cytochrome b556 subunit